MSPALYNCESPDILYNQFPGEKTALLFREKVSDHQVEHVSSTRPASCFKVPRSPYPVYTVIALYMFITAALQICVNSAVYNKVCFNTFHNLSLCANTSFTKHHPLLQDEAAKWMNYVALVQLIPAILSNLLLSSYCDQAGHKLPLILPAIGSLFACSWLAILTTPQFLHWPMETLLIYGFLNSALGHSPMIMMSGFSYVTRAVLPENRHIHIALAEGSILIGLLVGNLANGPIIDSYGLNVMVYISVATSALAVFIVCFFVVDILQSNSEFSWIQTFKMRHIFDSLKCVFKPRPGHSRLILQLCFAAYGGGYVCALSYNIVGFLYFVKEVGMTLTHFSIFSAVISALKSVASPLILLLAKKLDIDQLTTGQIAAVILIIGYTVMSLGPSLYLIWIGGLFISVQVVMFAITRNLQTKIVEKDELGKLFAYDALIQAIMNTAVVLSFDSIYSWSLMFWPQMFLAVGAVLYLFSFTILSIIILLRKLDASSINRVALSTA